MRHRIFTAKFLKSFVLFPFIFLFFLFYISRSFAFEYKVVRGIIDIHSNISDGLYSLERTTELAGERGLSVLIFTDSALRKWEYGLWPLRNLIRKTFQEDSVLRLGVEKYFKKFTILKKKFPELVLIPGLEVSPFYYWKGNPLSKNFSINDYHKRFLVMGLSEKDYQNLPIVGNRGFGYFSLSRFDQYHGQQGIGPYQDLIDYVNQKGGLVFWAHLEMTSLQRYKGIQTYSPPHSEDLFLSQDYTGFGVTFTSKLKVTEVGRAWDRVLLEYIEGARKRPVWIIGSLHYDGSSRRADTVETLFFVKDNEDQDILDALREGRMYVRFDSPGPSIVLKEFSIENLGADSVQITIKGTQLPFSEPIKVELISNGKLIKSFYKSGNEWTILTQDNLFPQEQKQYYRLRISKGRSIILSNPIFIE